VTVTSGLRAPEVVCIAASTGGPQAVGELLDALTDRPACPVLIIQHMPGTFTGRFAERLDRRSAHPVREAVSGAPLRAGEILVAPGDSHLRIRRRRVRLSHEPPIGGLRPRADLTFGDLATEYGPGATAIVLSGMGADGFDGAAAVVEAGGQVLTQDAASCTVDGMPARIRELGMATMVGTPGDLGAALERAWRAAPLGRSADPDPDAPRSAGLVGPAGPAGEDDRTAAARRARPDIGSATDVAAAGLVFALLRRHEGVDLRAFKAPQILRNLIAFARQNGYEVDEIVAPLDRDPWLRRALVDRLTINVTAFFRDPDRWSDLEELVIPSLGPTPRVWNPGCADGSETCSLAMLLLESGRRPRIWATDINGARVDDARAARYGDLALADLPDGPGASDRRATWFRRSGDAWAAVPELRSTITYERHEAIESPIDGPVPAPFDLVICRNVIIYLTPAGRDRLLARISAALADGGAVLLGSAERILRPEAFGFERIAPGLYRRRDAPPSGAPEAAP
jgi:chemotaxis protein methyltransferase CheR